MRLLLCCVVVVAVVVVAPKPCPTTTTEPVKQRFKAANFVFEALVIKSKLVQVKHIYKNNVHFEGDTLTLPCHLNVTSSSFIIFAKKYFNKQKTVVLQGSPILSTDKVNKALKRAVSKADVTRTATIDLQRHCVNNTSNTNEVNIICKYGDVKRPSIVWLKNNVTIQRSRKKYGIKSDKIKKESVLKIRNLTSEDADSYECRVTYRGGKVPPGLPGITIKECGILYPTKECDILYCHNNGSCKFYQQIEEYVCECADGYQGLRCESKVVGTSPKGRKGSHKKRRLTTAVTSI